MLDGRGVGFCAETKVVGAKGSGDGILRVVTGAKCYTLVFDVTRVLWWYGSRMGMVK